MKHFEHLIRLSAPWTGCVAVEKAQSNTYAIMFSILTSHGPLFQPTCQLSPMT
jgi:hypothetical protein